MHHHNNYYYTLESLQALCELHYLVGMFVSPVFSWEHTFFYMTIERRAGADDACRHAVLRIHDG